MKFLIKTLGCKVNQYDSLALKRKLLGVGFVWDEQRPEVVIVNTCAVTKNAIRKDRRMLNSLKTKHSKAKFVLMGCFPETYPEGTNTFEVDLVWGTGNLEKLSVEIIKLMGVGTSVGTGVGMLIDPPKEGERSRYFLKIQDGCEQFCSYCNIPFARGKLSSVPKQQVVQEVEEVIGLGFGEIVLCGIHLGLYGKEKNSKTCDLVELLKSLIEIEGLGRIRLSSIEANDISLELLKLMAGSDKLCNHLHLPLQSGSDKILKLMNRPYDTAEFEKVVLQARKLMPKIAITTDVIVGFPGEGDADFESTLVFVKKIKFSKLHVFPFSVHEKTPAAKMESKVTQEKIKDRAGKLRKAGEPLEEEYAKKFFGKKVKIVVEKKEGDFVCGKEEHYFDVKLSVGKKEILPVGSLYEGVMG